MKGLAGNTSSNVEIMQIFVGDGSVNRVGNERHRQTGMDPMLLQFLFPTCDQKQELLVKREQHYLVSTPLQPFFLYIEQSIDLLEAGWFDGFG